jgi:hypothetical protein
LGVFRLRPDDRSDLARCREHLRTRREFLLAQEELKRIDHPNEGRAAVAEAR